jgi:hypothetical protein
MAFHTLPSCRFIMPGVSRAERRNGGGRKDDAGIEIAEDAARNTGFQLHSAKNLLGLDWRIAGNFCIAAKRESHNCVVFITDLDDAMGERPAAVSIEEDIARLYCGWLNLLDGQYVPMTDEGQHARAMRAESHLLAGCQEPRTDIEKRLRVLLRAHADGIGRV